MKKKAFPRLSGGLALLTVFNRDSLPEMQARLNAWKARLGGAGLDCQWRLVGDGIDLPRPAYLVRLGAGFTFLQEPKGPWPALGLAAASLKAEWLLLAPGRALLGEDDLRRLAEAAEDASWIGLLPDSLPAWKRLLLTLGVGYRVQDLGAPCLVRRDVFLAAAAKYAVDEPCWGLRVCRSAWSRRASLLLVPSGPGSTGLAEAVGLDLSLFRARVVDGLAGAFLGSGALLAGVWLAKRQPSLGVALFGIAAAYLAYQMGRAE